MTGSKTNLEALAKELGLHGMLAYALASRVIGEGKN